MQTATVSQQDTGLDYLRRILLAPVYDVAKETELTYLSRLSKERNNQIYLKREDQQPVHSFKLRGAYNRLANLNEERKARGVVAASAGNHAQGVALSAQKLGIEATIVMPITTPEIKVQSVRRLGAQVKLIGTSFNESNSAAIQLAKDENRVFIPPFDDKDVIAGQGTVGKEILQQLPDADVVIVPVGGGGLLAGIATYLKQLKPSIKIIGVEAEDSACLSAAVAAGKPVDLPQVGLFADGVAVKRIGSENFPLIRAFCDQIFTVSNDEICGAIKEIFEHTRVIAEPAGAVSLAGCIRYSQSSVGNEKIVCILSGANMNFHTLRYVSERCELAEKKEAVLSVTIPEEKGSFKKFCQIVGGRVITEFNYRYGDHKQANIFVGVKLTHGESDLTKLVSDLSEHYTVEDFTDNELAKLHIRYMVGGQSPVKLQERLFQFEFPEYPGALEKFLDTLGGDWNITLFHYRNHGSAIGQVLAGFDVPEEEQLNFFRHLKALNYSFKEETNNPAFKQFLQRFA
ncbi:threonine ammonia-lyase, biosynthetic [Aliikangiella coralliicola]|uniref:L-threonine dehydratase n=1 Tax=Aliikangiella coralliicola TaxID=2592383 RepID=A0A545U7L0_9GAMM|nr:threonine ammonia-lyase, biosynthetic [Aliikangiella coralliicola]TQV85457.1 threonine ammonia-lyase, biosynthetic [Aliikangiella coralliicola]